MRNCVSASGRACAAATGGALAYTITGSTPKPCNFESENDNDENDNDEDENGNDENDNDENDNDGNENDNDENENYNDENENDNDENDENEIDDNYFFVISLLTTMRRMTPLQNIEFRTMVMDALRCMMTKMQQEQQEPSSTTH
ncbi:GATA zinc finger domain-containing protein 13-like [Drosophila albomicans]|uniref:GATA zinc finger domain-containing protein 13-like n=1 Tax=Drosophila albomicans TaxID=7291 RepID=A0A9C6STM7_DROAB|nr:GATA zinc finger domain-containing protein 13-like [Drosophila albomicans]